VEGDKTFGLGLFDPLYIITFTGKPQPGTNISSN